MIPSNPDSCRTNPANKGLRLVSVAQHFVMKENLKQEVKIYNCQSKLTVEPNNLLVDMNHNAPKNGLE